jgi:hypothetical protein
MTILIPDSLPADLWRGRLDLTAAYRVLLLTSAYSWLPAHNRRDDLTGQHAATGGYPTGGVAITLSDSIDTSTHQHLLVSSAVNIGTGPIVARWAAVVRWRGGAASDDDLVFVKDFGRLITTDGAFSIPALTIRTFK